MQVCSSVALATLLFGACSVQVDAGAGRFDCRRDGRCPAGFLCHEGECIDRLPGEADAAPPSDAAPAPDASCRSYREEVLADTPVQYLRFDDTSTASAIDSSGQQHHGSYLGVAIVGVPGSLDGDPNTAVHLGVSNGGDDWGYVQFGGVPASWAGDFTVEAIIRPFVFFPGRAGGIFVAEEYLTSGFRFGISEAGTLELWCNQSGCADGDITSGVTLSPATWNHVALTRRGGEYALYANGVEVGSGTFPSFVVPPTGGYWGPAQGLWMQTDIDEAALYDYALPVDRLAAHRAVMLAGPTCLNQ